MNMSFESHGSYQIPTLHTRLVKSVNECARGAFGIKRNSEGELYLTTQGVNMRVVKLSALLITGNGKIWRASESDLAWKIALSTTGPIDSSAQLVFFTGEGEQTRSILASDECSLQGHLLVVAMQNKKDAQCFALSAIFGAHHSSLLWDTTSDLINHWILFSEALEGMSNAQLV